MMSNRFRAGKGCVEKNFTLKQIGEKMRGRNRKVYVCFINLENTYDIVNMEALWQVLRMYDVDGKLLNTSKSMYVKNLVYGMVKMGKIVRVSG